MTTSLPPQAITAIIVFIVIAVALIWSTAKANAQPAPASPLIKFIEGQLPDIDIPRIVETIRRVENTKRSHIGAAGERSEYQITRAVWSRYSSWDFFWASSSTPMAIAEQKRVAAAHCNAIVKALPGIKRPVNAYYIGLVWAAGLEAVERYESTDAKCDYAQRCENVYEELSK